MKTTLSKSPEAEVGKYDSQKDARFEVRDDGNVLRGRLVISRGDVEWKPAKAQSGYWMPWDQFIQRMEG